MRESIVGAEVVSSVVENLVCTVFLVSYHFQGFVCLGCRSLVFGGLLAPAHRSHKLT